MYIYISIYYKQYNLVAGHCKPHQTSPIGGLTLQIDYLLKMVHYQRLGPPCHPKIQQQRCRQLDRRLWKLNRLFKNGVTWIPY
jgi:hypothetical protein